MADKDKKSVTVIINAREEILPKDDISFRELVILAFGEYEENPQICYSIGYSKGHNDNKEGELPEGSSIKVKEGMVFDVDRTDKS